jgi:hypothetical protein
MERAQGGDQYVGDLKLGAHLFRSDAFFYARGISAWVTPSVLSRAGRGVALTSVLGLEWDVSYGTLGAALDVSHTTWRGASTAAYVTFEVEQWR